MKILFALMFIVTICVVSVSAKDPAPLKRGSMELAEQNYISGINTENEGLQVSSAYYLGELKSDKAVIPLMRQLHESPHESVRIAAALSLLKIGDKRGIYAIYKSIEFDESENVRAACKRFYLCYLKKVLN